MVRQITTDDLLAFKLMGDVQLSPSGDRAAWVTTGVNREKNEYQSAIYMHAPARSSDPFRFTGGEKDASPRFSPDGAQLAFISKRSGQPQIWVMSVTGGEARQLTRVEGGVAELVWSPDGSRIAFIAHLKSDGLQPELSEEQRKEKAEKAELLTRHTGRVKAVTESFHKLDGVGWFGERRSCLCVVGLEEGAYPVQLTTPPYRVESPAWTPDGVSIIVCGRLGEEYDSSAWSRRLYAIPAAGGAAREILQAPFSAESPAVSPDGQLVACLVVNDDEQGYDNVRLGLVPLDGGPVRLLAPGWDRPFGMLGLTDVPAPGEHGGLVWAPDGSAIYALSSIDGTIQLVRVDVATGAAAPVTEGDRTIYSFSLDRQCRKAACGIADPLCPGDIFLLDLQAGSEERLTRINQPLLDELELSAPRRFTANAPDGPRVDGWVMKPAGFREGQNYPAVFSIHGGPMMMYASAFFFEFQLLASQGYGVIYSNPRGSQGYGEAFCKAIQLEWGRLDYADLMAVLDQAIAENPWIDAGNLGVTGGSYGGFMTNWMVGHTDRFRAAAAGRSIADWRVMVGSGDGGPSWIRRFGGVPPWVDDTQYKQQSPITYVENVRTPILIEHQEGDLRCPVDQAMIWYTAIKHIGRAPVRLVIYPEEFHGMSRNGRPWNRIHRLQEILSWFDTYLKV